MKEFCDKCHSKIINGRCDCGVWFNTSDVPIEIEIFKQAIEEYNKLKGNPFISMTDEETGKCLVLFKGDYDLCVKIKEFIYERNEP